MFKKIIFILIFSLIPSYSYASVNYDDAYWDNFNWDYSTPDDSTINLAKFYFEIEKHIEKSFSPKINVTNLNNLPKDITKTLLTHYENAAVSFGDTNVNLFIVDKSGVPDFNNKFYNWNNHNIKDMFLNCNPNIQKICAQADYLNRDYTYVFLNGEDKNFLLIPYHELAHVYFWTLFDFRKDPKNCWIAEGFANALGLAISSQYIDLDKYRNEQILKIQNLFSKNSKLEKEKIIKEFIEKQNDHKYCFELASGYSIGMLISEFMYINYGIKSTHEFVKSLGETQSFDTSSKKYFKLSELDFFNKAFEYVFQSYEKVLTQTK